MTLAIGIERRGRVWIGADGAASSEDHVWPSREPKVWRANGWIVAGAGLWRALACVRLNAKLPRPAGEASVWAALEEMRTCLERHGANEEGTSWLLGARGVGLYSVDGWGFMRARESTIGTAWDYALGWLDASTMSDPEVRIRECLRAASRRMSGSVRAPFTVLAA